MERNWREGKPKWVVEEAEKEITALKLRLALRWPDEARPTPVPFQWGGYDTLRGDPIEGDYWSVWPSGVVKISIRKKLETESGWRKWRFSVNDRSFTDSVQRGPLYESEREARLAALWKACDECARSLADVWTNYTNVRGYI